MILSCFLKEEARYCVIFLHFFDFTFKLFYLITLYLLFFTDDAQTC